MFTVPCWSASPTRHAVARSRAHREAIRPSSLELAIPIASVTEPTFMTGATGPNVSS
jgi:hypothetical protein